MAVDGLHGNREQSRDYEPDSVWVRRIRGPTRDETAETFRKAKLLGSNGDREKYCFCSANYEQDWQQFLINLYSAISHDIAMHSSSPNAVSKSITNIHHSAFYGVLRLMPVCLLPGACWLLDHGFN